MSKPNLWPNEERFERLVTGIKDYAIFMLDKEGRITTWNEGAKRITQYDAAEVIGQQCSRFYPPEEIMAGTPDREMKQAEQTGQLETEGWRVRKDGSRFWAHVTTAPIRENDGVLVGFSRITRDSSERRRNESQLRSAESKFRNLLETAPDAIVIVNEEDNIELVNGQTESIFGYDRAELTGQPVTMLMPERFRRDHVHRRAGYPANASSRPMGAGPDFYGRRKDGTEFPVDIFLRPHQTEGGTFVTSAIRDVSVRRVLEREREELLEREKKSRAMAETAARMRDELVAMVSHDLKNPLASILIGAQVMEKGAFVDEHGKKILERMKRSAERMQRMIQDLLDSHKIEAGRFDLAGGRATHSVSSVIERALEGQQLLSSQKEVRLEMAIPEQLPTIFVDAERIQQVLQNLIGNAIKFTPKDGQIRVKVESVDSNVRFSVTDTGPGISESLRPHLFERFSQDVNTARAGTGLGLSIAKAIIEAHMGKIWVESQMGIGTAFVFTLPRGDAVLAAVPEARQSAASCSEGRCHRDPQGAADLRDGVVREWDLQAARQERLLVEQVIDEGAVAQVPR